VGLKGDMRHAQVVYKSPSEQRSESDTSPIHMYIKRYFFYFVDDIGPSPIMPAKNNIPIQFKSLKFTSIHQFIIHQHQYYKNTDIQN